jgi:hypothetical protein
MKILLLVTLFLSTLIGGCQSEPEINTKSSFKAFIPANCGVNGATLVAETLGVEAMYYCSSKRLRIKSETSGQRYIQPGENKPVTSIKNGFLDIGTADLPLTITVYTYDPNVKTVLTPSPVAK